MEPVNPFNFGTVSYYDYEVLKDLKPHCSVCELKTAQAKTWQTWRQNYGFQFVRTESSREYCIRMHCARCDRTTVHRQLLSLEVNTGVVTTRQNIPANLAIKIKNLFNNCSSHTGQHLASQDLEIDHRVPQIRWNAPEQELGSLSDEELKEKFMLLTSAENLTKSRSCEKCVQTGMRFGGPGGLSFWVEGEEHYVEEMGCSGCYWHNPEAWRNAVQSKLSRP